MLRAPILCRITRLALVTCCLLIVAGCGAAIEPVLPTPRPTIPPPTTAPTLTPAPTNASQLTTSPEARIAPATATPGPSPTPLFAPVTGRPPVTLEPSPIPVVPGTLRIEYFTADVQTARPGDLITLFWSIRGAERATVFRVSAEGARLQAWDVAASGSLQVRARSEDDGISRFLLRAGDAFTQVEQTVSIGVGCTGGWFFEPQPTEGGCPSTEAVTSQIVQQSFERGLMLWVQTQRQIYVLYEDNRQPAWAVFPDQFQDGQPESDAAFTPPEGRLQPIRGFGLVWRTSNEVRDRLGWATAPEIAYDSQLQGDASTQGSVMYLRNREGQIVQLADAGASWKRLGQ